MATRTFVINPETGRPAVAVLHYQDIERESIETPLNETNKRIGDLSNQIGELQRQRDAEVEAAEALKSDLTGFDTTANGTESATGAEGTSGEAEAFTPAAEAA